jgi:hypothetical protein
MTGIQIVKRAAIPAITTIEEGGVLHRLGELRDLSWSEPLKHFVGGGSGFSASWVQLADQEILEPHTHPVLSMMVIYAGAGQMLGDLCRPLAGDEVVVVPPGCLHGFIGGPPGLFALSIQFAGGLYSAPEQPRVIFSKEADSLEQLLAFSERRASEFARKAMFDLARGALLADATKRRIFRDALGIWVDGIESLSASRYASCDDPRYQAAFREHLSTFVERGADSSQPRTAPPIRDAALEAITNWFAYQMYVLDNAEKTAIVSLVVDPANAILGKCLSPLLGECRLNQVLALQARDAERHISRGIELLRHATPRDYARWRDLVGEAWDMSEAMTDRVAAMTLSSE